MQYMESESERIREGLRLEYTTAAALLVKPINVLTTLVEYNYKCVSGTVAGSVA